MTTAADDDAARLRELGYEQELRRRLRGIDNVAIGFATISPVVGLYAVALIGTALAGPAWIWVLPVALVGPVPAARRLLRARRRVPGHGRAVPVDAPADRAALRMVHRLGRGVRVPRGEHDDRLPRRAVAADRCSGSIRRPSGSSRPGWCSSCLAAVAGSRGIDVLKRVVQGGIVAEGIALVRHRRRPSARLPRAGRGRCSARRSAPRPCRAARSSPGCSPRSPSAAGCSSASTRASARPRRRAAASAGAARGVARAAERRGARVPQRDLGHPRPPRPRRRGGGGGRRPGDHRDRHLVRRLVDEAVRRSRPRRVPRLRHRGAGADGADALLDRPRRRAARLRAAAPRRRRGDAARRERGDRGRSRGPGSCSASSRRRSGR